MDRTQHAAPLTVVEQFAADYFVVQGLTEDRQQEVLRTLAGLEAFGGRPPEELNDVAVRNYVSHLVNEGLHVNTVRKKLAALKPFYRWAWQQRVIDADAFMRVRDVEPPRGSSGVGRPRPYTRKQIATYWAALDARYPLSSERMLSRWRRGMSHYNRIWRHGMHLQVQAVTSLALFSGLRRQEILLAAIDDIHPDNEFVVVSNGKGGRGGRQGYREVPYTEAGRAMVGRWLEFRELLKPEHEQPWLILNPKAHANNRLAPSSPRNPLTLDTFENLMPSIGKGWELHRFRHTCATEWLRAGVELELVSRLLGHANIHQTLVYAELVNTDVARGMRRGEQDFVTAVGRRHDQLAQEAA